MGQERMRLRLGAKGGGRGPPGPARLALYGKGPQTAANRGAGSDHIWFFSYIKDLVAVQAVLSEPVSARIPCLSGKVQGIFANRGRCELPQVV